MALIGKDILYAAELLKTGQLVAIPTETVYGLAANALDPLAIASVFEVKKRPFFDPLIVHTFSLEKARDYVNAIPAPLLKLAQHFWPGPLTLLLPKKELIPDLVTSGSSKVAIRVPAHELALKLLKAVDFPLAAPSANPFGYISPTQPEHVARQLGKEINYILDGGACEVGLESTIVGLEGDTICIYRLGGLPREAIEALSGNVELRLNVSGDPKAPGQLTSHYAPAKPLLIGDVGQLLKANPGKKTAVLSFGKKEFSEKIDLQLCLSETGNMKEAAANLFSALRQLDESA
ncbi:MAG: L-threonylcarbamoyladenylate synthase, partial [Bacteroidia bacterium]